MFRQLPLLILLLFTTFSLSLPTPQSTDTPSTSSTTSTSTTTSATILPDPSGSSSSAVNISTDSIIGIVCGVVVIVLIAVGGMVYSYRKYQQVQTKRRTAIVMDEMAANLNKRIVAAAAKELEQKQNGSTTTSDMIGSINKYVGIKIHGSGHGRTGSVNSGKGKKISGNRNEGDMQGMEAVVVTEMEVSSPISPVDNALNALEGGNSPVNGRNGFARVGEGKRGGLHGWHP